MTRYEPIDPAFFTENRKQLCKKLPERSLAIFHSADEYPRNGDQNFPFRQQSDLFYLSGIDQEETILVLAPGHPETAYREMLFIRETNEQTATWEGHKLTKEEASAISGIAGVYRAGEFEFYLKDLMSWAEEVFLNANEYPKYFNPVPYKDLRFSQELIRRFPGHRYGRAAPLVTELRQRKSETEIGLIRKAGHISGLAFERVLKSLKPGMKEYQVQAMIEYEFTWHAANGNAYRPIIASGANACVLHYVDNNQTCEDGDLLLMDFGAEYANYAADITRTIPVNGRFSARQKECYEAVLRVHDKAIGLLMPGTTIDAINKEVNGMMEKEMIGLGLFTKEAVGKQDPGKPLFRKYFMHGTSHHIGLDVHDAGSKYDSLLPGMVLSCEPGLYIREENTGIRIENDILITENKPVNLTEHIPVTVADIESLMKGT